MKVLHCIPTLGGGGTERQLAYLAGGLTARGWDVHIATRVSGPNLARLTAAGAVVHWLRAANPHDPRLLGQLARVFRRVRPDVVQTWSVQMDVLGGAMAGMFGVPRVFSERSSAEAYPRTLKNRIRVAMARRASVIVANSMAGAGYWTDRVGPRVPTVVVANAVPFDEIDATVAAVPAGVRVDDGEALVLFAGRFAAEKGLDALVDALATVVPRPRTKAVLCGEGHQRRPIAAKIAAWGLQNRILVPGYIDNLWPLLKRADVVVSASHVEGHPNSVLEAMAARRPLVVSNIPAHRAILDEQSAFWASPGDAQSIAAALNAALDQAEDAERRGKAAHGRALAWSVDAAVRAYDRIYRGLIDGCGRSRTW